MSVIEVEVTSCMKALPLTGPALPQGGLGIISPVNVRQFI